VTGRGLLDRLDPTSLALRLTLLDLLLRPVGLGWVRPPVLVLAAAGLAVPRALRWPPLWIALAACTAWRVASAWPLGDNHAYLLAYWCLAAALALTSALDPDRALLARNARLLIGLAFALAVLWKVLAPDYLDGRFFRVILLVDPRFEGFATLAGGMDAETLALRRDYLLQHVDVPGGAEGEAPPEPPRFRALARAATHATLAIEAAVALAFLLPAAGALRDLLLLSFCAVTYAAAPVEAFGMLILAMGLAQSDPRRLPLLLAYLATFALLVLYREAPWASLLQGVFRS
jgi:hypothetical protein